MNKKQSSLIKDISILTFIFFIFLSVILIFFTEILKNKKIKIAKNNLFFVYKELSNEVKKCKDPKLTWVFGNSCNTIPANENISNYFNNTVKLVNPYDNQQGTNGTPGSVIIDLQGREIIVSVDIDANGGLDINLGVDLD